MIDMSEIALREFHAIEMWIVCGVMIVAGIIVVSQGQKRVTLDGQYHTPLYRIAIFIFVTCIFLIFLLFLQYSIMKDLLIESIDV